MRTLCAMSIGATLLFILTGMIYFTAAFIDGEPSIMSFAPPRSTASYVSFMAIMSMFSAVCIFFAVALNNDK